VAEATKGAHEAQQHSILVTQSCGQAGLETQNFGRTTPCRGALARIEFPFSSTLLNFSFSRPQVPLTLGSAGPQMANRARAAAGCSGGCSALCWLGCCLGVRANLQRAAVKKK